MQVLLRYHYFQPVDGRFRYQAGSDGQSIAAFTLVYSGMIPTDEHEPTEEILERLLLRHATELRPHSRDRRPIGTGDVLDVVGRGLWQVLPTGFRFLKCDQLALEPVN